MRHRLKKGFDVVLFMETLGKRFRVHRVTNMDGDMLRATVSIDRPDTCSRVLLHVGQAIWFFDVVETGAEPVPIGFGPPPAANVRPAFQFYLSFEPFLPGWFGAAAFPAHVAELGSFGDLIAPSISISSIL